MKHYLYYLIVGLLIFISCESVSRTPLKTYALLPKQLKEVSGMYYDTLTSKFWLLQDKGNKSTLYQIDTLGKITHKIHVNAKNIDWEELTSDTQGNLYIGDFGNNSNKRKNLRILKIQAQDLLKDTVNVCSTINFSYENQTKFPPEKDKLLFDAEAFVLIDNHFYIFTKNRSSPWDGTTLIYQVPNKSGKHQAKFVSSIKTGSSFRTSAITGAVLWPEQHSILLLTNTKLIQIKNWNLTSLQSPEIIHFPLDHISQKESVSFKDTQHLFICDERNKGNGGKIYIVNVNELKPEA